MFKFNQLLRSFQIAIAHLSTNIVRSGKHVIVSNLPTRITANTLKDHMIRIGPILQCEIEINANGERVGHVHYQNVNSATRSVELMNDSVLMGKKIRLQFFQPLPLTPVATTANSFVAVETSRLFLHNLAFDVTSHSLESFLRKIGVIARSVEIITTRNGKSKGLGVIELVSSKDVAKYIQLLQGTLLHGRPMGVREDRSDLLSDEWKLQQDDEAKQAEGFVPPGYEANSVFVGNLAMEVSSFMLKGHMSQVGPVLKASILRDRKNLPQGSGIVVYENSDDAARALVEMHDTELWGRLIFVREDKEARARVASGSEDSTSTVWKNKAPRKSEKERLRTQRQPPSYEPTRSVYVGNLAWNVNSVILKDLMSTVGSVSRVKVFEKDGKSLGNAIVEFESKEGAARAIEKFKGKVLRDRKLVVRLAEHK